MYPIIEWLQEQDSTRDLPAVAVECIHDDQRMVDMYKEYSRYIHRVERKSRRRHLQHQEVEARNRLLLAAIYKNEETYAAWNRALNDDRQRALPFIRKLLDWSEWIGAWYESSSVGVRVLCWVIALAFML